MIISGKILTTPKNITSNRRNQQLHFSTFNLCYLFIKVYNSHRFEITFILRLFGFVLKSEFIVQKVVKVVGRSVGRTVEGRISLHFIKKCWPNRYIQWVELQNLQMLSPVLVRLSNPCRAHRYVIHFDQIIYCYRNRLCGTTPH